MIPNKLCSECSHNALFYDKPFDPEQGCKLTGKTCKASRHPEGLCGPDARYFKEKATNNGQTTKTV